MDGQAVTQKKGQTWQLSHEWNSNDEKSAQYIIVRQIEETRLNLNASSIVIIFRCELNFTVKNGQKELQKSIATVRAKWYLLQLADEKKEESNVIIQHSDTAVSRCVCAW
jgi:hypothetical protein